MGTFSEHALSYGGFGLRVFPVRVFQDQGSWTKAPSVRNWQRVASCRPTQLMTKFPDAQIGILNDKLTVVDIDDPRHLDWAIQEFGDTPITVQTPGGFHLWYKPNGERRQVRYDGPDGRQIDILGVGGYTVAPPSTRPDGAPWRFLRGSVKDLGNLPHIRPGALPTSVASTPAPSDRIPKGRRDNALLVQCLRDLKDGKAPEILQMRAAAWNENIYDPPQSEAEVTSTVKSAIRMHMDGRNFVGTSGVVRITHETLDSFLGNADALMLYSKLQLVHGSRKSGFAIDVKAMSRAEVIQGWGKQRYRSARNALVKMEHITLERQGCGKGNPSVYNFPETIRQVDRM